MGVDPNGRAYGEFIATGVRPTFMDRLDTAGYPPTADLFRTTLGTRVSGAFSKVNSSMSS